MSCAAYNHLRVGGIDVPVCKHAIKLLLFWSADRCQGWKSGQLCTFTWLNAPARPCSMSYRQRVGLFFSQRILFWEYIYFVTIHWTEAGTSLVPWMLTRTIFSSNPPSDHVLTLEWFHCGGNVIQPWSDSTIWYALQVWDKQLTLPGSHTCILGQGWAKSTDATVATGLRMYGRGTWQHVLNPSSSKMAALVSGLLTSNYDAIPNSLLNPCN